ncbi:DUF4097 family beta strand repeat-containing protein [Streptomyces armeniacus]|uniref:DUF4097 family beta strand repeat-containing protein n=1 Tax=Streptomyces armeniacus TaxID=83291 RepID=UPI001AD81D86|nr:DUF4097 family beta strand repeat-containing protein [Streptomyces armeniacus]
MPADRSWQISEPRKLDFDGPIDELQVRIVNGTVNVVGTDDPTARLEISEVHGPPLCVQREGGRLVVAYEDLPWKGFLRWLDRKGWRRGVVVSLSVPHDVRLTVGVVGASAVVTGISGRTDVRGVSGDTTLVGLSGEVRAETVSGSVETQALEGTLRMNSVSGDLTVVDGGGSRIKADSVSGSMILDLHSSAQGADISLNTVSGEVAVRLPDPADVEVVANTTSGALSSAFDELSIDGQWGAKRAVGVLGTGSGSLRATSVSGAVALLRRPPRDDLDDVLHGARAGGSGDDSHSSGKDV